MNKALPIIYAAHKSEYEFMVLLRKYKSEVNFCTIKNESPFIEVIKRNRDYKIEEIKNLLLMGMDSNFQDMDKRNALHHLVFHLTSLDCTSELLNLLL